MNRLDIFKALVKHIQSYISDSRKNFICRSDVTQCIIDCEQCEFGALLGLHFSFVSKTFLLHNRQDINDTEPKRMYIKSLKELDEYRLISSYYETESLKNIKASIFNLSDTKYVLVISNLAYDALLLSLSSRCVYNMYWYKNSDKTLYIRSNSMNYIKYGPRNRLNMSNTTNKAKRFAETLLKTVSFITDDKLMAKTETEYSFSIFKINDIILATLFPKSDSLANDHTTINIWPIIPVSCVYDSFKFIQSLKISDEAKIRFRKLHFDQNFYKITYKITNLRKEIIKGITFPQMIRNKLNLNQIYVAYFLEFLVEHVHYEFPSLVDDCASYIQCCHCSIIFDNIFRFVRHWWEYRNKAIFRCHICETEHRSQNINLLGNHYLLRHVEMKDKNTWTPEQMMDEVRSTMNSTERHATNVSNSPVDFEKKHNEILSSFSSSVKRRDVSNPELDRVEFQPIKYRSSSLVYRRNNRRRRHFYRRNVSIVRDSNNDNNETPAISRALHNEMTKNEQTLAQTLKQTRSLFINALLNYGTSNNSNRSKSKKMANTFLVKSTAEDTLRLRMRNAGIYEYEKAVKTPEFRQRTLKTPEIQEYISRRLYHV